MGQDCSACSNCKGGQNEIKTQNDDMSNGGRGSAVFEDQDQNQQPVNLQSTNKKEENFKKQQLDPLQKQGSGGYQEAAPEYKDDHSTKSPPLVTKQIPEVSNQLLQSSAGANSNTASLQKQHEEINQEAVRVDTNENKMATSGSHRSKKKQFSQPLEEVPHIADQVPVREKRPAYQFKSGAIYDGYWIGNMRDGFGVQTWPDGAKYEGEWKDNKAHGRGKFWHVDGDVFEGEWQDDKANGQGTYIHVNGAKYEGSWKDDLQDGYGVETWADGSKYEGNYKEGKKHGQGTYTWSDQSKYVGEWVENRISGKGTYTWLDGRKYDGDWLNNNMHGKGVYTWKDGRRYEGEYQYDKKHGFGIYTWADGRRYEGYWGYGKQHGKGKYILPDNSVKIGQWEDGKRIKWLENETDIDGKTLETTPPNKKKE